MAEIGDTISTGLPQTAKEVIACAVVTVVLAAFIVSLRIYTRLILLRSFGKDDFCIIIALLFSIGNSVGMCMQATTALGQHIWDLTPEDVTMFFKEVYFTIVSYNIGLYFVKLSILFLYFRLFTSASDTLRRVSHVVVTIVVFVSLWSIFSRIEASNEPHPIRRPSSVHKKQPLEEVEGVANQSDHIPIDHV
ncbi:hypothetical protein DL768_010218 [Monosporascus sp. mg162]|nr:hypothetical protein DL768_010218 [Monosporascus sp. mg162]